MKSTAVNFRDNVCASVSRNAGKIVGGVTLLGGAAKSLATDTPPMDMAATGTALAGYVPGAATAGLVVFSAIMGVIIIKKVFSIVA